MRQIKKVRSLTREEQTAFLPWFLSQAVRLKIDKLLPRYYPLRLRLYYEKFGCIGCKSKQKMYGSNGLCVSCSSRIGERLSYIDARLCRQFGRKGNGAAKIFIRRLESAKRLLGDIKAIMER